jgi:hypothetical protein
MAPTSCPVTSTERTASTKEKDRPLGAVVGVLNTVLEMIEKGATHLGVATDHVIESFRNELWDTYTTGKRIEPALSPQFIPLEDALTGPALVHGEPQRTTGRHRLAMGSDSQARPSS